MPFLTVESLAIRPALGKILPPQKLVDDEGEKESHESCIAPDQSEAAICQEVKTSPSTPDLNPPSAEELCRPASEIYKEKNSDVSILQKPSGFGHCPSKISVHLNKQKGIVGCQPLI